MPRALTRLGIAATCAALITATLAGPAHAQDFYTPPSTLPAAAGDVVRTEPSPLLVSLAGPEGAVPAAATRLMYRSADAHGNPIAVTGTYFDPGLPWHGPGPRPLVTLAPGTQGQGDQCAPSKLIGKLVQYNPPTDLFGGYELLFATALLAQGYAVVMTDYEGLGTPGPHTYMNRAAQGHAVLDAARAAQRLPGTKITPDGPVFVWGYSQGGGGSAAALELHGSYAPELDVIGGYAGAVPADLRAVMQMIDGTALSGVIGYVLNGLAHTYPEIRPVLDANLNERGRQVLAETSQQCVLETIGRYIGQPLDTFVAGGRTMNEVIDGSPEIQNVLDRQRIGRIAPLAPVLLTSSPADDQVPHGPVRQLAADWCALGATVHFADDTVPPILPGLAVNHVLGLVFGGFLPAMQYLDDRVHGRPAPGC